MRLSLCSRINPALSVASLERAIGETQREQGDDFRRAPRRSRAGGRRGAGRGLARVEEVVQNVRRHADTYGLPPELVEKLWRRLIDWSIAREESKLGPDSLRKG